MVGFGKQRSQVKTKVTVSELTGKYLVMASVNGCKEFCVSPHFDKKDAKLAAKEVETVFSQFSPREWKDNACLTKALSMLQYEDDDEPIGVLDLDRQVVDMTRDRLADFRAVWQERDLLSDAVAERRKTQDHPFNIDSSSQAEPES